MLLYHDTDGENCLGAVWTSDGRYFTCSKCGAVELTMKNLTVFKVRKAKGADQDG